MKDFQRKRKRWVPLAGFACLSLLMAPALVSLGVESKIASVVGSGDASAKEGVVAYNATFYRQKKKVDTANGTVRLEDGVELKIQVNSFELTLKPSKHGKFWDIDMQVYDMVAKEIISRPQVLFEDGVQFEAQDIFKISFNFHLNAGLVETSNNKVIVDFHIPTEIRDLTETLAQLTAKNVVLDDNVQGAVQMIGTLPSTKDEVYKAFLSAFDILDLAVIETDHEIKIINKKKDAL